MSFSNFQPTAEGFINTEGVTLSFGIIPGMIISDFGCGSGHFTISMAKKVGEAGRVYAFDVQEAPLESVANKAKSAGLENVVTVRANLEILGSSKQGDGSQDIVLVANILFQSKQKKDILQEAMRITKAGGKVIVIDWKKGAKGFGPPEELRSDEGDIKKMATELGLVFQSNIDAGNFNFGMVFKKV